MPSTVRQFAKLNRLTYSEFLERSDEFSASVSGMNEIASFCSGPIWGNAAHESLHGTASESNSLIIESDGNWLVFVERQQPRVFLPLESGWLFGSPLIGDPDRLPELLLKAAHEFLPSPVGFCIGGVRAEGRLHRGLRARREFCRQFKEFEATDCMMIDLADGFDAWLARRSRKFRRTMRNLPEIEVHDGSKLDEDEALERMMAIQRQTYKWESGEDIFQSGSHAAFYRSLLEKLQARGELRLLFAQCENEDSGYIFGGVAGSVYRGFQMSYVEKFRDLGIGNSLQLENLRRQSDAGIVEYDLGMHSPYKERWADRHDRYVAVFMVV